MKHIEKKRLLKRLATVEDFRIHTGKIIYPLSEVLFMTLLGLLKGKVTFEALHDWMELNSTNQHFLKLFDKEEILIPSESTLHRILINVDNNKIETIFRETFKKYRTSNHIAVDGKWLNGSDVNGQYVQKHHKSVLNILDKEAKIVIAHHPIGEEKKSEIPAFKKELEEDTLFSESGQIFSFDAMLTQHEILNRINKQNNFYMAKLKNNQKCLKEKAIAVANAFKEPSSSHSEDSYKVEGNKQISRKVEVFQSDSCNLVLFDTLFDNIQSIIKVTKTSIDLKSGEVKTNEQYLIANFKEDAHAFGIMLIRHWRVETYHYHLDMLTCEDKHIAYINPYSISILRSFAVNYYQLFLNAHKGEKIIVDDVQTKKPLTMARIKRYCENSDRFLLELFETS